MKVALERSGLDIVIVGLDDFVLLAPTGTAFASTGADIGFEYPTLMNNPRLLEAIMRHHIVALRYVLAMPLRVTDGFERSDG